MRIGWSSGYTEAYWGPWLEAPMIGGSERIVVETAVAMAELGHEVVVRLPYPSVERVHRGVRWVGLDSPSATFDVLFCADDFARRDDADRCALVACRSDPPPSTDFDQLIFLSAHHARLMGHTGRPAVGGGVDLADYQHPVERIARRVICTSSPDRCPRAAQIGKDFDFKHAYKPVRGFQTELYARDELIRLQQSAKALIYPLEPSRPSDFFSMAVLEAMAAGTPVVVSDADSMPEMWADSALMLPNPVRLSQWYMAVSDLLDDSARWERYSLLGLKRAAEFTWHQQARRYLAALEV